MTKAAERDTTAISAGRRRQSRIIRDAVRRIVPGRTAGSPALSALTAPPLPPIVDLGRQIAALQAAIDSHNVESCSTDLSKAKQQANRRAMDLLFERITALQDLICTMPAMTLADAAVQVSIANLLASGLEDDRRDVKATNHDAWRVERITLSIFPLIARAAGIDLTAMDMTQFAELRTNRFHGVEGLA